MKWNRYALELAEKSFDQGNYQIWDLKMGSSTFSTFFSFIFNSGEVEFEIEKKSYFYSDQNRNDKVLQNK